MRGVNRASTVSVVIPTFNRVEVVGEAIESVLHQTHSSVEVIVVDDGSTDSTVDHLKQSYGADERVLVIAAEHGGVSSTRNVGIEAATGEYLAFLDSDDLMRPTKLELQLAALEDRDCDAVLTRQCIEAGGAPLPDRIMRQAGYEDAVYHMSILLRARDARAVGGFDVGIALGEDLDFAFRLALHGLTISAIDEQLVVRRYHGDNLSYGLDPAHFKEGFAVLHRLRALRKAKGAEG